MLRYDYHYCTGSFYSLSTLMQDLFHSLTEASNHFFSFRITNIHILHTDILTIYKFSPQFRSNIYIFQHNTINRHFRNTIEE